MDRTTFPARAFSLPGVLLACALATARAVADGPSPEAPVPAPSPEAGSVARPGEPAVTGQIIGRPNIQRVVRSTFAATSATVRPGQAVTLSLRLDIAPGWHVNSSTPTLQYLIGTRLEFPDPAPALVDEIAYPPGRLIRLKFADERLSVYEGETIIRVTVRPRPDTPAGTHHARARLVYQACSDTTCLPPETVEFKIPLRVAGEPVAVAAGSGAPGIDDAGESGARTLPGAAGARRGEGAGKGSGALTSGSASVAALLEERGLVVLLGVIFLGGLALNLTPCVYPTLPVTIGFFAMQSATGWGMRVALPSLYVLGMALTYSALGVAAGLSGGLIGSTLQNPWVVGGLVTLFVAMALSMFGLYEFRLPGALTQIGGGRRGLVGALVMGLTVGLVAAPCIGPFVVGLLGFVSASGDPTLGFWLFFVLALGMGLPSLFLGIFSGTLASLPRSGTWLIYAKKVMGIALLGVAIYFAQPFLEDRTIGWLALVFTAASAVYLGLVDRTRIAARGSAAIRAVVALVVLAVGIWIATPLVQARPELGWAPHSDAAVSQATAAGRPVVIDFSADWCLPCRELERFTFTDPRVMEESRRFALLKADLTQFESEPVRALRDRYNVIGVPTIVFIDGAGREREDLRLFGFEPAEAFLDRLRQVR